MDSWFNLPNGETATEMELTVPVKGRVKVTAEEAAQLEELKDWLRRQESKANRMSSWNFQLKQVAESIISGYNRTAENALTGASKIRDDMLSYLRSIVFVLETVVCDHINHSQKNDRIRGCISVIERHVHALREEKFTFTDSCWRVAPDLFHFNETERRLREKIKELEQRLGENNAANVESGGGHSNVPEQPF